MEGGSINVLVYSEEMCPQRCMNVGFMFLTGSNRREVASTGWKGNVRRDGGSKVAMTASCHGECARICFLVLETLACVCQHHERPSGTNNGFLGLKKHSRPKGT